jgi:heme o synthase
MIKSNPLKIFFELIKVTVTLPVTFLAFTGYTIQKGKLEPNTLLVCLGVFFLAGAASAINQIIEAKYDGLMERTKKRPIPSGRISKKNSLIIACILAFGGILILLPFSTTSVLLGLINLCWYIGVYTFLKRKTAFAVIPGSLTGSIPILIGFTAAHGNITDPKAILIAFFVFMWQIPHFWLLMLIYRDDYKKAGYPTLFEIFSPFLIRLWTLVWIIAAIIVSLSLYYFGIYNNIWMKHLIIALNGAVFLFSFVVLCLTSDQRKIKWLFHSINLFMLTILSLLMF